MTAFDIAANIALFLTERKGSCLATWKGKLSAAEQRALFGSYLGKGNFIINGSDESVTYWITVGFGGDYDETVYTLARLSELAQVKANTRQAARSV